MDPKPTLRDFANYIASAARAAGYDIDTPRSGGRTALAQDAGISLSTISRLLSGERAPDPSTFEGLARALRVPLTELLIQSGIVSSESLHESPRIAVRSRPITPSEAADDLGITDPVNRELFLAMVDRLKRQERAQEAGHAEGAAAEA